MRIGDHQQIELRHALQRLGDTRNAVAGVAFNEHRPHVVLLGDLILRQQHRVEPAGQRNAWRLHDLLGIEARLQPVVIDLPDPAPMPPRAFGEPVIERQRHHIEPDIGGALHVVVAAEDIGASPWRADIAGEQQRDAARAHIGGADRVLGLAHAPDQRRRLLRREHLRDALELFARHPAHPFDLIRRPLLDFLLGVVEAVDALRDEFLVLPAILKDVPHHAVEHRNIGARTQPDIFGRVRGGARQARIDDDEIRVIELGAFKNMLQRHRMRFRRIAAPDDDGLGIADIVEAVGHRAVAPGIGHAGDGGRMADARLMIGIVGAPEGAKLSEQIGTFVGHFGRAEPIHGIRPRFGANVENFVADLADGLIPGDAGPLAVGELHRIFEPAFAAYQFAHGGALGAMRAAIDRAVPSRLLADPNVVCDFGQYRAADRAMRADAFAHRNLCAGGRRRTGLRLSHRAKRKRAERRQAAGDAGAAQESAAIQARFGGLTGAARRRAAPDARFF